MPSNLTRIKNNQITDSTIWANAKIIPGSIVGSLFNSNITTTADFTITGNLTVLGSSTYMTVASTNTYVNDPLIVLNNGFAGSNTYDEGLIFNRGSGDNKAFLWSEAFKEFRLITTTEGGTTYGNVTSQLGLANLSLGKFYAEGLATVGSFTTLGAANVGNLNATGNVLVSTLGASYVTASTATFGNIAAVNFGNASAIFTGASINLSGNVSTALLNAGQINTTGNVLATAGVFNALTVNGNETVTGYLNVTGNVLTSTLGASYVTASTATFGNIAAANFGNASAIFTGASINLSGNVVAATVLAQLVTADDLTVGNIASGFIGNTGTIFTGSSINVTGNVVASTVLAQLVTADDATFGNVVSGFIGNTGTAFTGASLNVTGNVLVATINSTTENTSTVNAGAVNAVTIGNTGATVQGTTAQFTGNVIGGLAQFAAINSTPVGNVTAASGAFTVLAAANSLWANASIATTAQGLGAVVVPNGGISVSGAANIGSTLTVASGTQLNSTLGVGGAATFTNPTNSTSTSTGAVIIQGGASIAKDLWVGGNLYAANIIGVQANVITVEDPLLFLSTASSYPYNYDIGFYSKFTGPGLSTLANSTQFTGVVRDNVDNTWKFFSNTAEPGTDTVVFDAGTVWDPIKAGNLSLVNGNPATNATSGALQVLGGAGITGALYVGSGIQNTVIGNTTAAAGYFTSLNATGNVLTSTLIASYISASTMTVGNISAVNFGNASAIFTGASLNVSGNVSTALLNAGQINTTGNVLATAGVFNALTVNGNETVTGYLNVTGNVLTSTLIASYISASTMTVGNIAAVNFGNASAIFTGASINLSGNVLAAGIIGQSLNVSGNILSTGAVHNALTVNGTVVAGAINAPFIGNASAVLQGASVNITGNILAAGGVFNALNVNGNATVKSGNKISLGADIAPAVYPEDITSITGNANAAVRLTIQNINVGSLATTELTVRAETGTNIADAAAFGITSLTFAAPGAGLLGRHDAYAISQANKLVLASALDDVVIGAGGLDYTNMFARFSANSANVSIVRTAITTSANTGAFTVTGGVGFRSNLNVARGTVINTTNSIGDGSAFQVQGSTATTLIYTDTSKDSVVIGGSNTAPKAGITLMVNGSDSMLIPVGTTAQRPSNGGNVDIPGMLRLNSSTNNLEYYANGAWQVAGTSFTIIASDSFAGDGIAVDFTLAASATTAGCMVSVNGIVQIPGTSYSVSGATLTFTEAPATGDAIDVRRLTTTSTVGQLSTGYSVFSAEANWANIQTGTSNSTDRLSISNAGDIYIPNGGPIIYNQSATNIVANNTPYVVATRSQTAFTTAKYIVSIKNGASAFQSMEAILVTDSAGSAYVSTYGVVSSGAMLGTLSANVISGNARLYFTSTHPDGIQANVKVQSTYII